MPVRRSVNTKNLNRLDFRKISPVLERTARAVGAADLALGHHFMAEVWLHREQVVEAVRCAAANGVGVDRDRIYGHLVGLPLKPMHDFGADALALRYLRTLQIEAAKHRGISRRQREKIAPGLESDELRAAARA